ncbi:MAG: sigma-70 family RNA polymerase sigma factor [Ahniella sp.]|nr:sigma-70 family RNA polymerase sigma factor [Ahniella sp.]
MTDAPDFQALLFAWRNGTLRARDSLVELVYQEAREIARRQLARHAQATLAPTELAHEALMRVLKQTGEWQDRRHLMNVLALATRQVLIDGARRRSAGKRDAGDITSLDDKADVLAAPESSVHDIDEAILALAEADARAAEVISLTYFSGLEREAIADLMAVSPSTVDRALRFGRAWLKDALQDSAGPHGR